MKISQKHFRILPAFLFLTISFFNLSFSLYASSVSTSTSPEKTSESSRAVLETSVSTYDQLVQAIRQTRHASEARVEAAVEQEKVREAWETGKLIDEHILLHKERAEYGKQVIERLAKDLNTNDTELYFCLKFARTYSNYWAPKELSWSHIQSLLAINDSTERETLAKTASEEKWSLDKTRAEVRKQKSKAEPSAERLPLNAIPKVTPGKVSVYKVIEKDGKKYYDLGFSTYRRLLGNEPSRFKAGNYIFIKSTGATYQPSVVREAPENLYTYKAKVLEVVDGDTFHALIDLGFGISVQNRLRLRSLDAPEILSADGKRAKAALEKVLGVSVIPVPEEGSLQWGTKAGIQSPSILIKTDKDPDQHGRYLADVWVNNKPIAQELLDSGYFTERNGE